MVISGLNLTAWTAPIEYDKPLQYPIIDLVENRIGFSKEVTKCFDEITPVQIVYQRDNITKTIELSDFFTGYQENGYFAKI